MGAAELGGGGGGRQSTYSLQHRVSRSPDSLSPEGPHQVQTDGRRIPEHASQSGATSLQGAEKGEHSWPENGSGPRTWSPRPALITRTIRAGIIEWLLCTRRATRVLSHDYPSVLKPRTTLHPSNHSNPFKTLRTREKR